MTVAVKLSTCPECGKKVKAKGMGVHKRWCGRGKTRFAKHIDPITIAEYSNPVNGVGSDPRLAPPDHCHNGDNSERETTVTVGHVVHGHNIVCPSCGEELHVSVHA